MDSCRVRWRQRTHCPRSQCICGPMISYKGLWGHTGDTAQQPVVSSKLLSESYSEKTQREEHLHIRAVLNCTERWFWPGPENHAQAHAFRSDCRLAAGDLGQVVNLYVSMSSYIKRGLLYLHNYCKKWAADKGGSYSVHPEPLWGEVSQWGNRKWDQMYAWHLEED